MALFSVKHQEMSFRNYLLVETLHMDIVIECILYKLGSKMKSVWWHAAFHLGSHIIDSHYIFIYSILYLDYPLC